MDLSTRMIICSFSLLCRQGRADSVEVGSGGDGMLLAVPAVLSPAATASASDSGALLSGSVAPQLAPLRSRWRQMCAPRK